MTSEAHWRGLERVYLAAPINRNLKPRMIIGDGICTVSMSISDSMHHTANALHGSIYFKMLDEAAFFAANSLEPEVFMLTSSFNTYLTRPVSEGILRAKGKVVNQNRSQIISEAVICDEQDREIGRGSGLFVRSKILLKELPGYLENKSE